MTLSGSKCLKLGEMTVNEVRDYLKENRTVLIPYGVVEQHGYHLPLDTDIKNAEVLGEKLAKAMGCVLAPTLNYCFSGGTLEGTVNIKPNTFSTVICDIIESFVAQGFENIIILPGHGGSESLIHLKESLRINKWLNGSLRDVFITLVPPWDFSPSWLALFRKRDYHAGLAETSLIMYWAPEAVRKKITLDEDELAEMMRDDPDAFQERTTLSSMPQEILSTAQDPRIKVGVMGYPENASAELGKKIESEILNNAVPALQKAVAEAVENRNTGRRIRVSDDNKLKILSL